MSATRVLITGASSGIGAALAREYARRGARLVLLARRTERLEELAAELQAAHGSEVTVHAADVTASGAVAAAIAASPVAREGLDVVVANAGFSVAGPLQALTLDDYRRQFETNVFGTLQTVYESLAALRQARGRLAIVGSVAGHAAASGGSAYSSSKFAVRALAESLRGDLRAEGIVVTLLSPGFVDSDIRRVDNLGRLHPKAHDPIPSWVRMRADKAARAMANAIARGQAEAIITFHGKLIVFMTRHCSGLVRHLTAHYVRWRRQASD